MRGLDSNALWGQWSNWDRSRWTWALAANPVSSFLFIIRMRCSIPICVVLSRMGARPRPASFSGLYTSSVGKLGKRPKASLIVLLSMPSIVVNCGKVCCVVVRF